MRAPTHRRRVRAALKALRALSRAERKLDAFITRLVNGEPDPWVEAMLKPVHMPVRSPNRRIER